MGGDIGRRRRGTRPLQRALRHLVIGAVAVTSVTCSDGDTNAPAFDDEATTAESSSSTTLDTADSIIATDAGATVTIPAGSISDPAANLTVTTQPPPGDTTALFGDAVSSLGQAIDVTLSGGTLTGPATVSFTLPADFDSTRYVPAVVWEAGDGTWELLESQWAPGDEVVTATTTHFTIGWPIRIDTSKITNGTVDWVKGLITGRSGAGNPACGDESAPRAAVQVVSDSGDLVKWCYGRDNGRDVVKVTNNWRAGTQVTFPKTWTVVEYQGGGFDLQTLGDWLDSKTLETSTTISRLVGPGQTIVLDPGAIAPGDTTKAVAETSTVSWAWSSALIAVDMYLITIGKLAKLSGDTKAAEVITGAAFIKCFTDSYGDQINVLAPVKAASTFDTVVQATRFGLDCGKDVIQAAVSSRGGLLGAIGARVVGVLAAAVGILYGLVNNLFSGIRNLIDNVGVLFDNTEIGGLGYDIILTGTVATAPTAELTTCEGLNMNTVTAVGDFGNSVCSSPWALVAYTELDERLNVALIDMTNGTQTVAARWTDVKRTGRGGYSVAAVAGSGPPLEQAQLLFEALYLGAPIEEAEALAMELYRLFAVRDRAGLATYGGGDEDFYQSLFEQMDLYDEPFPVVTSASCSPFFVASNEDSGFEADPYKLGDVGFFCFLAGPDDFPIAPWVSMDGDLSAAYVGMGG